MQNKKFMANIDVVHIIEVNTSIDQECILNIGCNWSVSFLQMYFNF